MNAPTGTNEPTEIPKGCNGTTGTAYWSCCANVKTVEEPSPRADTPRPEFLEPSTPLTLMINGEVLKVDRKKFYLNNTRIH